MVRPWAIGGLVNQGLVPCASQNPKVVILAVSRYECASSLGRRLLWDKCQPADEVDVVWGDLGEGFGWDVGFEAEVVDDVKYVLGLFGGVLGCLHRGSEGSDGAGWG